LNRASGIRGRNMDRMARPVIVGTKATAEVGRGASPNSSSRPGARAA
jgi:hypothetical protein